MPADRVAFQGDLELVSLASVLQLIEGEAMTARLTLDVGGEATFHGGRPVGAVWREHTGAIAFLELFLRGGSQFTVTVAPVPAGPPLGAVVGLIMEGCRLADEWRRIAWQTYAAANRPRPPEMDRVGEALLPHIDGRCTLEGVVDKARLPRSRAIDPLLALMEEGLIYLATSAPPPIRDHGPLDIAGFGEAMDQGRTALRAGDFDRARRLFTQALALRPEDRVAAQNLRRVEALQSPDGNPYSRWHRKT